jgi:hypothetical protein
MDRHADTRSHKCGQQGKRYGTNRFHGGQLILQPREKSKRKKKIPMNEDEQ